MKRKIRLHQHADPNDTTLIEEIRVEIRGSCLHCVHWKRQTKIQGKRYGMCWKGPSYFFKTTVPEETRCTYFERRP